MPWGLFSPIPLLTELTCSNKAKKKGWKSKWLVTGPNGVFQVSLDAHTQVSPALNLIFAFSVLRIFQLLIASFEHL